MSHFHQFSLGITRTGYPILVAQGEWRKLGEEAALRPFWQQSPGRESQHIMVEGRGGECQQYPRNNTGNTQPPQQQQQQQQQQPAAGAAAAAAAADARSTNTDRYNKQ